jgi:uncharacterized protein (DUF58 family)
MPDSDPMAEIRFWVVATAGALLLDMLAAVVLKFAGVPTGNAATILALVTGFAVLTATNLRGASDAKVERDRETRQRQAELDRVASILERENRARAAEIALVARKADEVKTALAESDIQRDTQVGKLQGSVETIHAAFMTLEEHVHGAHGVVLKALAAALAREAARPDSTPEQKQAATEAEASAREHDEQRQSAGG